jgi:molybdopterin converting factor small subunit
MGVEVKVKFFASGRELAGTDGLVLQLPDDDANTEAVTRVRRRPRPVLPAGRRGIQLAAMAGNLSTLPRLAAPAPAPAAAAAAAARW